MLSMNELVDLRMQQQIAHEIYRQQIMQRIPDPFSAMFPMAHHVIMPPRPTLPGVEAKLENNDLWQQFHKIGTEMIITKSGRRMFPSMRVSLSGLEEESQYCVLLEMVPIGDCRYKFSGSQWVPAGGAEPQSPQRMFLHPDSPATGAHWQSQAILFNKVKLTNNTLDNNGHIVLASMHKYQPRLHVIRTSDLAQIPWSPQQAFVFPETEFVAVTAYQNDRITKLKIDNNPFAKGFRETGQSRCKRKLSTPADSDDLPESQTVSPSKAFSQSTISEDDRSSVSSFDSPQQSSKRLRSADSCDEELNYFGSSSDSSSGSISPHFDKAAIPQHLVANSAAFYQQHHYHQQQQQIQQQALMRPNAMQLAAAYFAAPSPQSLHPMFMEPLQHLSHPQHHLLPQQQYMPSSAGLIHSAAAHLHPYQPEISTDIGAIVLPTVSTVSAAPTPQSTPTPTPTPTSPPAKRNNFSISAILAF